MIKRICFSLIAGLSTAVCPAVTVTVAPTTGVSGTAVTDTIVDAISQVNAGADTSNTITLRSTEGALVQGTDLLWSLNDGKSADFTAESGQPVVVIQSGGTRYMLAIKAGTNANNQTELVTFTGIAFVPQTGLSYISNKADGLSLGAGNYHFTDCVFSNNDGSNGVASQEGDTAFDGTNCVGDDWIQMNGYNDLTFSHCTITGALDEAVLAGGAIAPEVSTITFDNGTCVANNGGAGVQDFGTNVAIVCNGENGRVLFANNGNGPGGEDVAIKFFAASGCSLTMNKTDMIAHPLGGIVDYNGVPSISITDSRIALNNSGDNLESGNFSVLATANAAGVQNIDFNNVTFHDTLGSTNAESIFSKQNAGNAQQVYTIVDSIFSGAGDSFANMTNAVNSNGASPAPVVTFSAVVTNGPAAIADAGELGAGTVNSDPAYVSDTYTIGRSQENPTFLLPTGLEYLTASSNGTLLRGGAPGAPAGIKDFMLY